MIQRILIFLSKQELHSFDLHGNRTVYPVSTAKNGSGQLEGSFCTPLGYHIVKHKIGHQLSRDTVFKARTPQIKSFTEARYLAEPNEDWILSRILWLSGCEPGFNRLGEVDSKNRYIYIHGTPDQEPIDQPLSHGCIRMRCDDVITLFDQTPIYTQVQIQN
ncbi:hypothetical protein A3715_14670 [Oleiphilus sp. HI0009]|uniref:L,D-transpeptidase n=2 Tax=Oleiphilus TaxID=141450 RepID=UPI0007C31A70|nr:MULTISPECIES: L,D-transpeptidase [unclassified Oleiphilus]KZX75214.1 hypothetical protein A3715_14670 [Oleiphilus sp. HI0009]KZY67014.1 hypothetical protein A3739_13085 [Oleiphilus sp. HI0067]KZY72338.1 hypothetical protein A3738_00255 [Oleiphilus sp. HI0066]